MALFLKGTVKVVVAATLQGVCCNRHISGYGGGLDIPELADIDSIFDQDASWSDNLGSVDQPFGRN